MIDFIIAFLVCGIIFFAMPLIMANVSMKNLKNRLAEEESKGMPCAARTRKEIKGMKIIRWAAPLLGVIGMIASFFLL